MLLQSGIFSVSQFQEKTTSSQPGRWTESENAATMHPRMFCFGVFKVGKVKGASLMETQSYIIARHRHGDWMVGEPVKGYLIFLNSTRLT